MDLVPSHRGDESIGDHSAYILNAPEGCPHGTHTSGTAYTRGTYLLERTHTIPPTNTNKHAVHVQRIYV